MTRFWWFPLGRRTAGTLAALAAFAASPLLAQPPVGIDGVYHPLDQTTPPGVAGQWAYQTGRLRPWTFQPIRVLVPDAGTVTFYHGPARQPVPLHAPAQLAVAVGQVYRLRLSHMPEYPGVELFPTIELIDRLNPPPGTAGEFPVPIEFTHEEIDLVLAGHLVTKVVYLEEPRVAAPVEYETPTRVLTVPPHRNLLAEADRIGRPMVLVRLGGRVPDPHVPDPEFFGTGAPVVMPTVVPRR